MDRRFLIIGGSGFIGRYVVSELAASYGPQAVRLLSGHRTTGMPKIRGLEFVEGDIADVEALRRAVRDISVVIHLAGDVNPARSNDDIGFDIAHNLLPTVRLLEICQESKIGRLIYESSGGAIYGNPKYTPVDEDHPTSPLNSYGVVKRASELYLTMFEKLNGFSSLALRIANPYGPGQMNIGTHGFVGTAVACALRGEPLTIWGDGLTARDFVFVEDVAKAITIAAISTVSGVMNIGTGRATTQLEIVEIIERKTGKPVTLRFQAARSSDVRAICLDGRRAESALGWTASTALEPGIERTILEYRNGQAIQLIGTAPKDAA